MIECSIDCEIFPEEFVTANKQVPEIFVYQEKKHLRMEIDLAERIICAIYYFILGIFGLIANIGIFVVLWRCKDYRTRQVIISTAY